MTLKNTDNCYIIEVRNTQTIDGVQDVIEEKAAGRYYERGEKKYIIYETAVEGGTVTSSVIVADGAVTIRRSGDVKSNMTFDIRRKTMSPYYTPYGALMISAETDMIASALDSAGGSLRIKYTLTIQGEKYYNDMMIKVIGDRK